MGATALKLEDQFESITEPQQSFEAEQETVVQNETSLNLNETKEEAFSESEGLISSEESLFEELI